MSKRKITKKDVQVAYATANKAKQNAMRSLQQARQLRDGADRMNAQLKKQGGDK